MKKFFTRIILTAVFSLLWLLMTGFGYNHDSVQYIFTEDCRDILVEEEFPEQGVSRIVYNGSPRYINTWQLLNVYDASIIRHSQGRLLGITKVLDPEESNTVFIGDSRFVFMQDDLEDENYSWICRGGGDYRWLRDVAKPMFESGRLFGRHIVIELGINDLMWDTEQTVLKRYLDFYNGTAQQWIAAGADVSVLYVFPPIRMPELEKRTRAFNNDIKKKLPANIRFIDMSDIPLGYRDECHMDTFTDFVLMGEIGKRTGLFNISLSDAALLNTVNEKMQNAAENDKLSEIAAVTELQNSISEKLQNITIQKITSEKAANAALQSALNDTAINAAQ